MQRKCKRATAMRGAIAAIAAALGIGNASAAATQTQWKLVDLGTLSASGINKGGAVVGCTATASGTHAFVYQNGAARDLGPGCADAVNDQGVIAGHTDSGEMVEWTNGAITHLAVQGRAIRVNNGGVILAVANDGTTPARYFTYHDGAVTNLGFTAMDMNDAGQIVGQSNLRAVVYENGTLTNVGNGTIAAGINASDVIVGMGPNASGQPQPFLYNGAMQPIGGSYSDAVAVNNADQVACSAEGTYGYVWENGTGTSFSSMPDVIAAGMHHMEPVGINDQGWIVGNGMAPNGDYHGFLLIPESSSNVALASNGATALASSQYSANYPVSAVIDGDATGTGWSNGGGWADGTAGQYPDWVEVDFAQASQVDHVVVYTVQDNWQAPSQPTDTMTFTQYGITAFDVQAWNGTSWQTVGSVSGNNLVKRTVTFPALTTSRIRIVVNAALNSLSRVTEIEAWTGSGTAASEVNVASASAGAAASASSEYSSAFPVKAIIDGDATGAGWSNGGGWADGTYGQFPDWAQVTFAGPATLTKVVVYTLQDNWQSPSQPTDSMTFSQYGVTDFDVQGWDGTQWVTLASITGNNLVKRTVTFNAFTTSQVRIVVRNALQGYARITEVEAWGTPGGTVQAATDWALASNGGIASASSQYNANYPAAAVIDGDRKGTNWSAGGGWADGTQDQFPDWIEVDFNAARTLSTVNVYTVQDNWQNPAEPTDTMTFTQYGVTDFTVQAWDGSQWQTVASVAGNNLVKRSVPVSVTTSKIRINVTGALYGLSRITEVEALGR